MAEKEKNPNQILLLLLLAGGGYYLWKKNKEKQAMMMARQGGEEEASGGAGGGAMGGGAGGGGFSTPIIQSGGEGTEINVEVSNPTNPTPSMIDCIKFPNTAGCQSVLPTQEAVEPVRSVATGGGGLATGGGVSTGGANPRGNTSPVATQPKAGFIDFDGDFDYMEGRRGNKAMDFRMKDSWAKTDFDGEL